MNTGIADAHNLAWKLALVLRGHAGPGLLDTYDTERHPVGAMTVEQATLRLTNPRLHWDRSPALAEARRNSGVLNAPVVTIGYRYDSAAIADPVTDLPSTEDITLDLNGDPGSRVPHLWATPTTSTLDLIASRFTVLTDSHSDHQWTDAARHASAHLGIDLGHHRVDGLTDVSGITADSALLIRPDGFIAWRHAGHSANPQHQLQQALRRVLQLPTAD